MFPPATQTTGRRAHLLSIVFLLSLISFCTTKCIHDKLNYTLTKLDLPVEDRYTGRSLVEDAATDGANTDEGQERMLAASSIRIYVDYSNLQLKSGASRDFIQNVLMPAATSFYSKALKVNYPISGYLYVPSSIATQCNDAAIPSYIQSGGVLADLILFVTASYDNGEDYIAYAAPCLTDKYNRAVAGEVHFNLAYLEPTDKTQLLSQISTVLHETAHVLGFSDDFFPYFMDPSTRQILADGTVVKNITRNGVKVTSIVLPNVLSRARTYFGCNTLDGLDLEDQGGSGSAGSHWERKILWNEVLTASDLVDIRYSQFTLALLEGSGWYTADYSMADPLTWGQGEGCGFITSQCVVNKQAVYDEFCTPSSTSTEAQGCTWGGQYKGVCSMKGSYTLNSAYNYFGDGSEALDPFVNNCPYYFPYTSYGTCKSPTSKQLSTSSSYFPEAFGDSSSCFQVTLSSTGSALSAIDTGCFNSQCTLSGSTYSLTVTVGTQTVTCTGSASTKVVSGYSGLFYCPDVDTYCSSQAGTFCNYNCLGRGTCKNNVCVCKDGWSGDGCATRKLVTGCSRCGGSSPNCYGDACVSGVIMKVGLMGFIGFIITMFLA